MSFKKLKVLFHSNLENIYPKEEIDQFFYMLTDAYYGVSRLNIALNPEMSLEDPNKLIEALSDLKKEVPIQHIIGETEFYGLKFKVNKHTLIPRPETEELVDWILNEIDNENTNYKIIDIGTGSGCIAVSLAKHLNASKVFALDVSEDVLSVARNNAILNGVNVNFVLNDILKKELWNLEFGPDTSELGFDFIISNPPYVRNIEKKLMRPNVLNHEPHKALFVENKDPLLFYRIIMDFSNKYLSYNGKIFFEINEYLGEETAELVKGYGFEVNLKKDIFGKDRMIKAVKKK